MKAQRLLAVLVYGSVTALSRGSTTLLALIYAGIMNPQDLGAYAVALSIAECLGIVADFGMSSALLRHYFDFGSDEVAGGRYLSRALLASRLIAVATLSMTTGVAWFAWDAFTGGQIARWPALAAVFGIALFDRLGKAADSVSRALGRPKDFAIFRITQAFAAMSLGLILVVWINLGVIGALSAILGSLAIAAIVRSISLAGTLPRSVELPSFLELKQMFAFGWPFVPRELAVWGRQSAVRLVVANVLSLSQVAQVFLAYSIGSVMLLLTSSIDLAFSPYYYKKRAGKAAAFRERVMMLTEVILAAVAPIYVATILVLLPILWDQLWPANAESLRLTPIILVGTFLQVQQAFTFKQLLFHRKSTWVAVIALLPVGVALAILPLVIQHFGLEAALWTMSASNAVILVWSSVAARQLEQLDFPVRAALLLTAVVGISAIISVYFDASLSLLDRFAMSIVVAVLSLGIWIIPRRDFIKSVLLS